MAWEVSLEKRTVPDLAPPDGKPVGQSVNDVDALRAEEILGCKAQAMCEAPDRVEV